MDTTMQTVFAAAALAMIAISALVLVRLILGPSIFDRALALNVFGTKTVLLIALLGFSDGRPEFLDIAILYALLNFVATVAVLKFFRHSSFAVGLAGGAPQDSAQSSGES